MTVLILADEADISVDYVVSDLGKAGVPVARIDTAWFPQDLSIDAEIRGHRWTGHLATRDRVVSLADVRSVWYRAPTTFKFPAELSLTELVILSGGQHRVGDHYR